MDQERTVSISSTVEVWGVHRNMKVYCPDDLAGKKRILNGSNVLRVVDFGSTAQFLNTLIQVALKRDDGSVLHKLINAQTEELIFIKYKKCEKNNGESPSISDQWGFDRQQVISNHTQEVHNLSIQTISDTVVLVLRERDIQPQTPLSQSVTKNLSGRRCRHFFVMTEIVPGPASNGQDEKARLIDSIVNVMQGAARRVLVTSTSALRGAGHSIRMEGSTSAAVEDIYKAILARNNAFWSSFQELVVRIRGDALLYFTRSSERSDSLAWNLKLIYTKDSERTRWSRTDSGLFGLDSVIVACLVNSVNVETSLKESVVRLRKLVLEGYMPPPREDSPQQQSNDDVRRKWIENGWLATKPEEVANNAFVLSVNPAALEERRDCWNMLEAVVNLNAQQTSKNKMVSLDETVDDLAERIVCNGCDKARHEDPSDDRSALRFPIRFYTLGKIITANRAEVDGLASLHRLIWDYIERDQPGRPLCLGVFGPPGSGKSFGVKQIAKSLSAQVLSKPVGKLKEFNVSQFTALSDLAHALHVVRDECLKGEVPVAIFDEFDADFQGNPFGWLKYFLMPMQDGKFIADHDEFHTGQCILVFAGGINGTFAEFSGRQRDRNFCAAKGPDFISRLRGAHDVPSLNPDDSGSPFWRIRRAILLRNCLEHQSIEIHDTNLIRALLGVESYFHGARSLEAVINMCSPIRNIIDRSSLPPRDQLDLHLDAREFWSKLNNSQ